MKPVPPINPPTDEELCDGMELREGEVVLGHEVDKRRLVIVGQRFSKAMYELDAAIDDLWVAPKSLKRQHRLHLAKLVMWRAYGAMVELINSPFSYATISEVSEPTQTAAAPQGYQHGSNS
jgi:hypothetical protein